jgi:hypothetical protein
MHLPSDMSLLSHTQYSVSISYSLKLSVTKLYREYIPSCVIITFQSFNNKLVNNFIAFILERMSLINNSRYTYTVV